MRGQKKIILDMLEAANGQTVPYERIIVAIDPNGECSTPLPVLVSQIRRYLKTEGRDVKITCDYNGGYRMVKNEHVG
ncbi:hypothetical protein UFOVP826_6 [uncultured Caudovirales phage]|uniref:Uncharacterized protein n=1 Tax=uncultured Caudovirales phage TaxID=2100421 RepID=A0A6J5NYN8_9CAUD|nr:hypothetical protein UFOVP826_6 [uncultured Caudovirales phage]